MKKKISIGFWIAEGLLLVSACVLAFALIGYTVMAMLCAGLAVLIGIYRLIGHYSRKSPKRARTFRIVLNTLVIVAFTALAVIEIPIISAAHTDDNPEADYVVVLGAGVNGTVPSLTLLNRLSAAKSYLDRYPNAKAVVSGGQGPGEDITEAECMRRWLEENGVAEERILIEDKSTSTYENLKFSLEVIDADGGDAGGRIALVSNEYHLYRAKHIASDLGVEALGVAASTPLPILTVNYFIREAFAVVAMWIM